MGSSGEKDIIFESKDLKKIKISGIFTFFYDPFIQDRLPSAPE